MFDLSVFSSFPLSLLFLSSFLSVYLFFLFPISLSVLPLVLSILFCLSFHWSLHFYLYFLCLHVMCHWLSLSCCLGHCLSLFSSLSPGSPCPLPPSLFSMLQSWKLNPGTQASQLPGPGSFSPPPTPHSFLPKALQHLAPPPVATSAGSFHLMPINCAQGIPLSGYPPSFPLSPQRRDKKSPPAGLR